MHRISVHTSWWYWWDFMVCEDQPSDIHVLMNFFAVSDFRYCLIRPLIARPSVALCSPVKEALHH